MLPVPSPIFIRTKDKWHRIVQHDILWLQCAGNYVTIVTQHRKFHAYTSLARLREKLDKGLFRQVQRSYIVNIHKVDAINRKYLEIGATEIPMSDKYRKDLFESLVMI